MYKRDEAFYLAYVLFRVVKRRVGVTLYVLGYAILSHLPNRYKYSL